MLGGVGTGALVRREEGVGEEFEAKLRDSVETDCSPDSSLFFFEVE